MNLRILFMLIYQNVCDDKAQAYTLLAEMYLREYDAYRRENLSIGNGIRWKCYGYCSYNGRVGCQSINTEVEDNQRIAGELRVEVDKFR